MLISYRGRPVDDFLEVIALSDHEWRVCDGRVDSSDASRLLAFIQLENGAYEVLRLSRGPSGIVKEERASFDCIAAALASLSVGATAQTPHEA